MLQRYTNVTIVTETAIGECMNRWTLVLTTLLVACGEKEEEPIVVGDTDSETCGGTPPVIQELTCVDSGLQTHPDYGQMPTFTIKASVNDEDGDLTVYQIFVDIDGTLDGIESEDDIELNPVEGSVVGETCGVFNANVSFSIFLNGTQPDFDTVYEWYVRVADGLGKMSEPMMIECRTPA